MCCTDDAGWTNGSRVCGSITNGADDEASRNRLPSVKQQADSITIHSRGRGGTNGRGGEHEDTRARMQMHIYIHT